MIITTCEAILGKELEYLGLVSVANISGFAGNRKAMNSCATKMIVDVEADLSAAGAERGADAVVGVKFIYEKSFLLAVGTAVKLK